jgi:hypothetical protein
MTNRDNEMIKAIAVIKAYCNETDDCNICPMYDNCYSDRLTAVYPLDWYVPEV